MILAESVSDAAKRTGSAANYDEADLSSDRFLPSVQTIADILIDGFDHPEVWNVLVAAARQHDGPELIGYTLTLARQQRATVRKALLTAAGVMMYAADDAASGAIVLDEVQRQSPHCPQVAGALFFVSRLDDPNRSADLTARFCAAPFTKFETLVDGTVAPCCSIWTQLRLGHLEHQSAGEIWNSDAARAMRESVLDGSFRFCHKQRCTFIKDDTLPLKAEVREPALRQFIDEGQTHLARGPQWLFMAHDVTCNLGCPSCRNGILAADEAQEARFQIVEDRVFKPMLASAEPIKVSIAGQGDPWSSQHYRSILKHIAENDLNIDLAIHSNGILMNEARWAQYRGLDKYRPVVDISIDACNSWTYKVIRTPGRWERLLPNLSFLAAKRARGEFRELHLNATIQLDNFHEIPAFVSFAERLGADTMRMYMLQPTGNHLRDSFGRMNVGSSEHPLYLAFLETLRDACLDRPASHLYDVEYWRNRSFQTVLPSDGLPANVTIDLLVEEIAAESDLSRKAALCAAGRRIFGLNVDLLLIEARVLHAMGFAHQAQYRLDERVANGGDAVQLR